MRIARVLLTALATLLIGWGLGGYAPPTQSASESPSLRISRLGIHAPIFPGDGEDYLSRGLGHVPGTAVPGGAGNVAIAGHRDTLFRPLKDIRIGDLIQLEGQGFRVLYRVSGKKVTSPDDVSVLAPDGENRLTLVTCFPFYYVGHAPQRFIVQAREIARMAPIRTHPALRTDGA